MVTQPEVMRYYPGCSLESSAREMGESFEELMQALGIRMEPLEDWSCCGSSPAHAINPRSAYLLAARNLILAEEQGVEELVVMCPSCFVRLSKGAREILQDERKARDVNKVLGADYKGRARPKFFLEVLDSLGLDRITRLFKHHLRGLRVAPYYGCLLSRPEWLTGFDVARHERFIERLITALGAQPVRWPYAKQCCGASLAITSRNISDRLVDKIRSEAVRCGAECLVAFCSLCQMNLEMRGKNSPHIPVLYITELLAAALGSSNVSKWFSRHLVDPVGLFRASALA